jgi:uncharacterized membrane protein YgdD (TMEM256/DUF423 family)
MASADSSRSRTALVAAGILGATGVTLGALGAHALKATLLERGMANAWDTGAKYHLLHAVALLGWAAWRRHEQSAGKPAADWVTRLWVAGVVLFSGSLYWLATGGPGWLGPVTPFGGFAFIAGWILVAAQAFRRDSA